MRKVTRNRSETNGEKDDTVSQPIPTPTIPNHQFIKAMSACNNANNFTPLSKLNSEDKKLVAKLFTNRYKKPTSKEIDNFPD